MRASLREYIKSEIAYNLKRSKQSRRLGLDSIADWYRGKADGQQCALNAIDTWDRHKITS